MCSARGLRGLLGATKRRILSFADPPVLAFELPLVPFVEGVEVLAAMGVPLVVGVAEGMIFDLEKLFGGYLRKSEKRSALNFGLESHTLA